MLYDNALLALAYVEAFGLTGHTVRLWRCGAGRFLHMWVQTTDAQGGFYCGQDADSDGVERKVCFLKEEICRGLRRKHWGWHFVTVMGLQTWRFRREKHTESVGK